MLAIVGIPQGLLADPLVALPLLNAFLPCNRIAPVYDLLGQLGIGRESSVVLLDCSVGDGHFALSLWAMELNRVGKDDSDPLFTYASAEVDKVARIAGEGMLEVCLATEVLHIRIHHPCSCQCLVSQIVKPFQHQAAYHEAYRLGRLACVGIEL